MLCPHSAPWAPVVTVEWGRHQLSGAAMLGSQCAFSGQRCRAVLCTEGGARLFTEDRLLEPEAILLSQCDFQHLKIALGRTSLELKFSPRTQPPENTCHEAKSIIHPSIRPFIHLSFHLRLHLVSIHCSAQDIVLSIEHIVNKIKQAPFMQSNFTEGNKSARVGRQQGSGELAVSSQEE